MNNKFKDYGVVIEQVNIMNIMIPKDLREALTFTTNYDVMLQQQVKQHDYNIKMAEYNENYAIWQLKRDNIQKLTSLTHDKDVEEINQIQDNV